MWYFRARVDTIQTAGDGERVLGRPEPRKYLGYCDEIGKREAEKRRDEMLDEAINRPQVLIPSQVLFEDVLRIYRRDHVPTLRGTSQAQRESTLRKYFSSRCPAECGPADPCEACGGTRKNPFPAIGRLRMCDIDTLAVQRWISSMELAYSTKKGNLALLKMVWEKAEEWGFTRQSFPRGKYALGVERDVKGHEMPSIDQLQRLLAALEDPFRAMAEVALYAGLRISEVRGLKWEDIAGGKVTIRRRLSCLGDIDVPKSKRGFRAFDARAISGVLARLPRTDEWVFNHDGCSYANCTEKMQAARVTAGITIARFGWHHLRAVCNTLMRQHGADTIDRQAQLGHADAQMNAAYVLQSDDDLRRRGDQMMAVQSAIIGSAKGVQ